MRVSWGSARVACRKVGLSKERGVVSLPMAAAEELLSAWLDAKELRPRPPRWTPSNTTANAMLASIFTWWNLLDQQMQFHGLGALASWRHHSEDFFSSFWWARPFWRRRVYSMPVLPPKNYSFPLGSAERPGIEQHRIEEYTKSSPPKAPRPKTRCRPGSPWDSTAFIPDRGQTVPMLCTEKNGYLAWLGVAGYV